MRRNGIEKNVVHFSAAIAVCAKYREAEKALFLLREMIPGIEPTVTIYNFVISACGKGKKALDLLPDRGIKSLMLQFRCQWVRQKVGSESSPSPARSDRPWHQT